jgi:hypothetical protein
VDQRVSQLRSFSSDAEFAAIREEARLVQERISRRQLNLALQLGQPELKLIEFHDNVAQLSGWVKMDEPSVGKMEQSSSPDGTLSLHIKADVDTLASWRTKALLLPGHYRFEGKALINKVKPLAFGLHQGAGLRVGGQPRQSENFTGDSTWRSVQAEFQVDNALSEIELICELRASAGEVWFDTASLRVVRTQ